MKKLFLVLMLLVLPSMAWASTSRLECSADTGVSMADRVVETFLWGGMHITWTSIGGLNKNEDWRVESYGFNPYGVKVRLIHIETGQMKEIIFNNGWICRSVWTEDRREE